MSDGSNIRVVVRCRGRNDKELRGNSRVVVDTTISKREIAVNIGPPESLNSYKTYTVDQVFGPEADQIMMFEQVVSPLVDDCISGLNCTVFAYGQTGTGKTYTMSGDVSRYGNNADIISRSSTPDSTAIAGMTTNSNANNSDPSDNKISHCITTDSNINCYYCSQEAGVIPRVLFRLFSTLEGLDYAVSVSFVELYNEELRDLLIDDDSTYNKAAPSASSGATSKRQLRLQDDPKKGGVTLHGISECHVRSAKAGLDLLRLGLSKRQTGATKMNDVSSRSHTIFTVNVAVDRGNDDIVRSKMNLVDLAGSESVGKSGAENKRAREAGMINQSLLTLGRVINSLVDKSGHIPYRESKLTRLLQDSLGGHTKTCIIATVSPALVNMEETLSTLEYASRAKNIRNKPQMNMVVKKSLLGDFSNDLEKLRLDLTATRKKNGIHMDEQNYRELMEERESQRILVAEQRRRLETMDKQLKGTRESWDRTQFELSMAAKELSSTKHELRGCHNQMNEMRQSLEACQSKLNAAMEKLVSETDLRKAHAETETQLQDMGQDLINAMQDASAEIEQLRRGLTDAMESQNVVRIQVTQSSESMWRHLQMIEQCAKDYGAKQSEMADSLVGKVATMAADQSQKLRDTCNFLTDSLNDLDVFKAELFESTEQSDMNAQETYRTQCEAIKQQIAESIRGRLQSISNEWTESALTLQQDMRSNYDTTQQMDQLMAQTRAMFAIYDKHVGHIDGNLGSAKQLLDTMAERCVTEREDQMRSLQKALTQERTKAMLERKKLTANIAGLLETYASDSDMRLSAVLGDIVGEADTESGQPGQPFMQLRQDSLDISQTLNRAQQENSQFRTGIMQKLEDLQQTMRNANGQERVHTSSHIDEVLKRFQEQCQEVIRREMVNIDTHVAAMDGFLLHSGEHSRQRNAVIADGVANMCNKVRQSFVSLETNLKKLEMGVDILNGTNDGNSSDENANGLTSHGLVSQLINAWTTVQGVLLESTDAMNHIIGQLKRSTDEEHMPSIHVPSKRRKLDYKQVVLPRTTMVAPAPPSLSSSIEVGPLPVKPGPEPIEDDRMSVDLSPNIENREPDRPKSVIGMNGSGRQQRQIPAMATTTSATRMSMKRKPLTVQGPSTRSRLGSQRRR